MERRKIKNRIFTTFAMATLMLAMLVVGACGTKKSVSGEKNALTVKELKALPAMKSVGGNLSAKLKLNANINGKSFSASGNIKIKRGEGLQISVNALGGLIEVARVEMTPEKMLLIYRLGREYAEVRYSDIQAFDALGLDYSMLEAIFLNELFAPAGKELDKELGKMDVAIANGEILLTTPREKDMQYVFHVEQNSGRLVLTQGDYSQKIKVDCNYADFTELSGRAFPGQINIAVANIKVGLSLSSIKDSALKLTFTGALSSYSKMDVSSLIKGLKF